MRDKVTIDRLVAKGRIPKCETCGTIGERNERYDAYACLTCNVWLEERCDDPECGYCPVRPDKPMAWPDEAPNEALARTGIIRLSRINEQSLRERAARMAAVDEGEPFANVPNVCIHRDAMYHPVKLYHRQEAVRLGKLFVATTTDPKHRTPQGFRKVIAFMHRGLAWTHEDFRGYGISASLYNLLMDHYGGVDAFYARFYAAETPRYTAAGLQMVRRAEAGVGLHDREDLK